MTEEADDEQTIRVADAATAATAVPELAVPLT